MLNDRYLDHNSTELSNKGHKMYKPLIKSTCDDDSDEDIQ